MSRTVTYLRNGATVELQATPGRTSFESQDDSGFLTRFESRDWLVNAEDLVIDDVQTTPRDGDRIQEVVDGETYTYALMTIPGQQAWRWCDAYRKSIRIHTKQVSA